MTKMEEDKPTSTTEDMVTDDLTGPKKMKKPLMGGQPSASEETASKYPDMELCQKIHRLTTKQANQTTKEERQAIFDEIAKDLENPSLYKHVVDQVKPNDLNLLSDADLKAMEEKHVKTMEDLEKKVEDAEENAGDMEVMEARVQVARFAAKSLSEKETLEAYQKVIDLPKISSGKKIDALMETSRVASFYGDTRKSDEYIERVSYGVCSCVWYKFFFVILFGCALKLGVKSSTKY